MKVLLWLAGSFDRRNPTEHLLIAMMENLCKLGHSVHVLQKDTKGPGPELPEELVRLGITTTRIPCAMNGGTKFFYRYLAEIRYALECSKWISHHREFDRVFVQSSNVAGIQVFFAKRLLKNVEITYDVQDIFPENAVYSHTIKRNGMVYRVLSALQRYAYRNANRIVTISEDMRDQLTELKTPADKIKVIYNWSYQDTAYDIEKLDYSEVNSYFDKSKYNVVYAGNIGVMQNVELVIRTAAAMKNDRDIQFHVFGDGTYKERLVSLAEEIGADSVIFHPMLSVKSAPALYATADVNVIPLARDIYRTALPSKTATCIACGKPIVFAFGSGSKFGQKVCENTGAMLVDSDDVRGLADAIETIRASGKLLNSKAYFEACFSRTYNSSEYANMIIGL